MFAGTKTSPILLTSHRESIVISGGTAMGKTSGSNPSDSTNNIVIGSGFSIKDPMSSSNILIGISDKNFSRQNNNNGIAGSVELTSTTAGSVIWIGSVGTSSPITAAASPFIVIGEPSASPGQNSVSVGNNATASGANSTALGYNVLTSGANSVSVGSQTQASGAYAISIGGGCITAGAGAISIGSVGSNKVNGINITATSGFQNNNIGDFNGVTHICNGYWSTQTAGIGNYLVGNNLVALWRQTTDDTPVELGGGADASNAPTGYIQMSNATTFYVNIDVAARKSTTGGDYAAWTVSFLVAREAGVGTTSIVGTPTITQTFASAGAISGAWGLTVTADTTNGRPAIKVIGQAATTIRWVAAGHYVKVAG